MEAETLKMRTGVKIEVMASGDHIKDSAALSSIIVNGGGGNHEASQRPHDPAAFSGTEYITGGWTYPFSGTSQQHEDENENENENEKEEKVSPAPTEFIVGGWTYPYYEKNSQQPENENEEKLSPASNPIYFNPSNSLVISPNGPIGITISPTQEVQEIYLKKMFVMPPNHEFYCPTCKVCIDKVLFCQTQRGITPPVIQPAPLTLQDPVRCSECFSYLIRRGKQFFTGLVSCFPGSGPEDPTITIPEDPDTRPHGPVVIRPENSKGWEILKSVVYGGLAELLASLSVVTSAASADATTLNIFALGIANLIGGLFLLAHNLRDLKTSQPREEGSETDTVDKYYELLGKRENHLLHAFVAILSFLIFGLVPPIVYGFSFRESDDKDFKLVAVGVASLICITLLATAKAYIQRPNNYLKTISFYVSSGVLASLLTYLAGTLVNRLIQQLGWFEPARSNFGLFIPQMGIEKPTWGSF